MDRSAVTIAAIADDLTGAQEMGALLAAHGLRTIVRLDWSASLSECDALVVDTESRHIPPGEAAGRVRSAVEGLRRQGVTRFFKKIDSTLRGPVAAEVLAFRDALESAELVFTPAYPVLGRVVRGGTLFVNGMEASATEFGRDVKSPVVSSRLEADGIVMRDAESEDDLQRLVEIGGRSAFAGSGGLGRAWVRTLPAGNQSKVILDAPSRTLLVCGSLHPVSRAQTLAATATGTRVVKSEDTVGNLAEAAERLVNEASQAVQSWRPDLLILFGGDTAYTVLRSLGVSELIACGELLPGVALSKHTIADHDTMVVTKAGGFGDSNVVEKILESFA